MAPLHFYFDFISPFGYFASLRVQEIARRHGRTVEWHAMLLGVSVLKVMGLKPLLDTPLKGDYIRRDAQRYMRRHGMVLKRGLEVPSPPCPCLRGWTSASCARTSPATRPVRCCAAPWMRL